MAFHYVEPEVTGELGPGSLVDNNVHPPIVSRLEYVFSDWLGDCLLETFPCYIVTEDIANSITQADLTGVTFDEVTISVSEEAEELIEEELPAWKWLRVTGEPQRADFGISEDYRRLVISDEAREVLEAGGLANADIEQA